MSQKYSNINKLNKKIDVLGYFKGIRDIENQENSMSGLALLVGLIIVSTALVLPKHSYLDFMVSFLALLIGGFILYKFFGIWNKFVNELLDSRINEEDLERLMALRENGEETERVVNKILGEHDDGMLTYLAIAKHFEELVEAYNKERSIKVKEILNIK